MLWLWILTGNLMFAKKEEENIQEYCIKEC